MIRNFPNTIYGSPHSDSFEGANSPVQHLLKEYWMFSEVADLLY